MAGNDSPATTDDPGALAVSTPEPPRDAASDAPVLAVGVGPGSPEFLTERAVRAVADADAVVGFGSVLDVVRDRTDATLYECSYDDQVETIASFADAVAADDARGVAVLWGDPNVSGHQFVGRVERALECPVRVVPGVSSVQVAASRARTPLDESTVVSLHRRGDLSSHLDRLVRAAGETHLVVVPRPPDVMPERVAAHLCDGGVAPETRALVFERLTLPEESRTDTTLGSLASEDAASESGSESRFHHLSLLVVRR